MNVIKLIIKIAMSRFDQPIDDNRSLRHWIETGALLVSIQCLRDLMSSIGVDQIQT